MNLKCKMIMDEYREARPDFIQLGDAVAGCLRATVKRNNIEVLAIEHRVKAQDVEHLVEPYHRSNFRSNRLHLE